MGQRVISDGTPHPPRRHQIEVPHVSGAGWGENSVPATQAVTPAAPRPSAHRTHSHDRLRNPPEPLESTVAPRAAPGVRRARSPPPTGAFVLVQSPSRHDRAPVTLVSLPSSSVFSVAPLSPRTCVHSPLVSFHLPPLFCVLGARLKRGARHPTGGCGPVRDRSPRPVIAFSRSRCIPLAGGIRWSLGVAATPGGRSSPCFLARHPAGGCSRDRHASPVRESVTGLRSPLCPFSQEQPLAAHFASTPSVPA